MGAMINLLRKAAWRLLGPPPSEHKSQGNQYWSVPVDTVKPRREIVDMAVYNIQIATRCQRAENSAGGAEVEGRDPLRGHYAEFGVYRGDTFIHAYKRAATLMPWMHFFAFDSFQGLPEPAEADANGEFWKGQWACPRDAFEANLAAHSLDSSRVTVCEGWFEESLTAQWKSEHGLESVAIAYIDCDLYSSCVPVLEFLCGSLHQGAILIFDDWYCFRGDEEKGVQRATKEWLKEHPEYELTRWIPFSHHGQSFIVSVQ